MYGFCPLASGSKGNCIYFGSKKTKLLIDAGLSGRATAQKLASLDITLEDIDAILISHDHVDHIQGLKTLALRHNIPILANAETAKSIYQILKECPQFKIFETGEPFEFQDVFIHPFSVQHDTVDPVAFTLQVDKIKVGICTDLGFPTTLVKKHLRDCDYLYVEANHEPSMVHACSRPMVYKQRVLGRNGHLSNEACAELLSEVVHSDLKHIYLAHLSQECNLPQRALERVRARIGDTLPISIAYQEHGAEATAFV
ncbi:MAG: MBL fold metallo-hydrolase [Verrucomicrobia bacterium]|nr:MBL fold metallo-hydrolase [Verrucomicrobiota bacterium]MBS0647180.1 MBL fold metallo-hydrolase [Verrucomicrobiota bacterium]